MTNDEKNTLIIKLKCCSANYADSISTKLQYGSCDETIKLMLLNGLIDLILRYDLTEEAVNCITLEEFEEIINKSKNICNLCDCN